LRVSWALGWGLFGLLLPLKAEEKAPAPWLSRSLSERILEVFMASSEVAVRYEDTLGDGPGTWDPRPGYPGAGARATNCIHWVLETLAQVYAPAPDLISAPARRLLDRLRYYEGIPAWGARKHFMDQMLEEGDHPWVPLASSNLPARCRKLLKSRQVSIDPQAFAQRTGYRCGLPKMRPVTAGGRETYRFEFLRWGLIGELEACVAALPPGVYGTFGVPSRLNLKVYGTKSGVMGRTHPGLLIRPSQAEGKTPGVGHRLLHASIRYPIPTEETLREWHAGSAHWFEGVQLFRLKEHWPGNEPLPAGRADLARIRACERDWVVKGGTRTQLPLN
jgi:hypothetical protein